MIKKGIILAGGAGSRLFPLTNNYPKSLLPVYDKPMIYYPLSTLIENGVNDVCIISSVEHTPKFKDMIGNGSRFGIKIEYKTQERPKGIPEAFTIAENFIKNEKVVLILGDNVCSNASIFRKAFGSFKSGSAVFAYEVTDPERYGVVEFDSKGKALSVEEKPEKPKSRFAIPGIYLFDKEVVKITKNLKPSGRGELEITDVIKFYLKKSKLIVYKMNRGCAWLDSGTSSSLHEASVYVSVIERRQGVKIGCPEAAAYKSKLISKTQFKKIMNSMPECEYKQQLKDQHA